MQYAPPQPMPYAPPQPMYGQPVVAPMMAPPMMAPPMQMMPPPMAPIMSGYPAAPMVMGGTAMYTPMQSYQTTTKTTTVYPPGGAIVYR